MNIILFFLFLVLLSLFVIGIMSPPTVQKLFFGRLSRWQALGVLGGLAVIFLAAFAFTVERGDPADLSAEMSGPYAVTNIVDGDTIRVDIEGQEEPVRLIGIDAPETVHPELSPECYGEEATRRMKELLEGERVLLQGDTSQANRDVYERLLRYVFTEDSRHVNELMLEEGYAFELTFDTPYRYQTSFQDAEEAARDTQRGLWSPETCDGQPGLPVNDTSGDVVKMSRAGICHEPGSTYYEVTVNFTPYETLQECLDDGGRLPVR